MEIALDGVRRDKAIHPHRRVSFTSVAGAEDPQMLHDTVLWGARLQARSGPLDAHEGRAGRLHVLRQLADLLAVGGHLDVRVNIDTQTQGLPETDLPLLEAESLYRLRPFSLDIEKLAALADSEVFPLQHHVGLVVDEFRGRYRATRGRL